ncbi:type I-C CRISPR-associated protein Cas5c [uncultured Desulfovibrio sp.]|uniref:type I-C CRISPR-associated protein Cas5c n=1 Tax=uncultured Desulfovibrio sp. TaxID=167968 RepID=UPI00262625BD|nr:type I-C CRISPR-associated protein Cas5c [uncultured Desulfovibrio sp.]
MRGVRLKVWGEHALFTRPENKAERMSYDVPTPSAARGILEAIHWKPAIRWEVERIHVLNPIVFDSIRRNEVGKKGPAPREIREAATKGKNLSLSVEDTRQQRASLVLRHVAYVIEASFELTDKAGPEDNEGKHIDIFRRRAARGACFQQPCLGCREFPAYFSLLGEEEDLPESALRADAPRDLGLMLYDLDFAHGMRPMFYRPRLEQGIIDVARWKRETLCRI